MEELLFGSVKCAAGYINGDLKKTVFRRFLTLVNSDIQNQDDTSAFPFSAVFVATAYGESTEEEREILNKHITDELSVIPELVGALKSFWKEGQYRVFLMSWVEFPPLQYASSYIFFLYRCHV